MVVSPGGKPVGGRHVKEDRDRTAFGASDARRHNLLGVMDVECPLWCLAVGVCHQSDQKSCINWQHPSDVP